MKLKSNSIFIKYLVSYVIMFMIPTLMLTFFIRNTLLESLEEQYLKSSSQSLSQLAFMTDKSLEQMNSIREHLLINKTVKPNFLMQDVKHAKEIIGELSKYTLSSSFLREMALWFCDDSYVYTTSTTSTLDQYLNGILQYENEEAQQRLLQIDKLTGDQVIPYQMLRVYGTPHNVMTVMMPIKLQGYDAVILFLSEDFFGNAPGEECYLIFDEEGTLIRSMNLPKSIGEADYKRVWESIENGVALAELDTNDGKLSVSTMASQVTGWHFVKLATEQEVYGDLKAIQNKLILLLLSVMLIGMLVTALNMALNYNPVRRLKKAAEALRGDGKTYRSNEIQGIHDAIHELSHENQTIKRSTASIVRLNFLHQLIKGRISGKEYFEQRAGELELDGLMGECFFVLICSFKESGKAPEVSEVEMLINQKFRGYCREHSEAGIYIFIGSFDKDEEERLRYGLLDVHSLLEHMAGCEVVVACGSLCTCFNEIPRSYMDASLALDYRFIKGWNHVIEYGELVLNDHMGAAYPHQLFDQLACQLKCGNVDQIGQALDGIISYIKQTDLPLYYAKGLCYQLINSISVVITELNQKLLMRQSALSYATVLAEFQTADEMVNAVRNICLSICAFIRESKEQKEEELIDQMKGYISSNCCDINFTVQFVAERFAMSPSALSLFFKKQCGSNISDYVTVVRMERAKELLTEGGRTLNEVSESVGYTSASSFIRRFKLLYGVTPGQFTTQHLDAER